jgi:hypothetical protein
LTYCADAQISELTRLTCTIDSCRPELLAYFDNEGVSNGSAEAINLMIKKIKRVSATYSATSTSIGSAYSCTAAPTGTLSTPPDQRSATRLVAQSR